jgi:hypothetical protein
MGGDVFRDIQSMQAINADEQNVAEGLVRIAPVVIASEAQTAGEYGNTQYER